MKVGAGEAATAVGSGKNVGGGRVETTWIAGDGMGAGVAVTTIVSLMTFGSLSFASNNPPPTSIPINRPTNAGIHIIHGCRLRKRRSMVILSAFG
jgi:hypothetical protein